MLMTMDYFCKAVLNSIREQLGNSVSISITPTLKNNGTKFTGLAISEKGSSIAPTIYLDGYYKAYIDGNTCIADIRDSILGCYRSSRLDSGSFDLSGLSCWEQAEHKLVYRLVNYDANRELLKETPHKKFLNLAVTCHYIVDAGQSASMLVKDSLLDIWGITQDEVFQAAKKNTPRLLPKKIRNMIEAMVELGGGELCGLEGSLDSHMYNLTNERKVFGASCILYPGVLKEFADAIGSDLYILPSSVHEVILLPTGQATWGKEGLSQMVKEVNRTQVAREETLSDHVYYYSRAADKITM